MKSAPVQPLPPQPANAELSGCEARTAAAKVALLAIIGTINDLAKAAFQLILIPFGRAEWKDCRQNLISAACTAVVACISPLAIAFPDWIFTWDPLVKGIAVQVNDYTFSDYCRALTEGFGSLSSAT